jgi:hypothetical protein
MFWKKHLALPEYKIGIEDQGSRWQLNLKKERQSAMASENRAKDRTATTGKHGKC